jgi:hypothetical protein
MSSRCEEGKEVMKKVTVRYERRKVMSVEKRI